MSNATILVLSRYPDLFARIRKGLDEYAPETPRILVRSGHAIAHPGPGWRVYQGQEPFVYARNANLGIREASPDDVILIGDDVILHSQFVEQMTAVAYSDPRIGCVVPELGGQSIFVFCYLKREMIQRVGFLDERFDGYGYEDNDYYTRYEAAGYRTQVCLGVQAEHQGGTSYYRRVDEGAEPVQDAADRARATFEEKWKR